MSDVLRGFEEFPRPSRTRKPTSPNYDGGGERLWVGCRVQILRMADEFVRVATPEDVKRLSGGAMLARVVDILGGGDPLIECPDGTRYRGHMLRWRRVV